MHGGRVQRLGSACRPMECRYKRNRSTRQPLAALHVDLIRLVVGPAGPIFQVALVDHNGLSACVDRFPPGFVPSSPVKCEEACRFHFSGARSIGRVVANRKQLHPGKAKLAGAPTREFIAFRAPCHPCRLLHANCGGTKFATGNTYQ